MQTDELYQLISRKTDVSIRDLVQRAEDNNRYYIGQAVENPAMLSYYTEQKIQDMERKYGDNRDNLVFDLKNDRQDFAIMAKPGKVLKAALEGLVDSEQVIAELASEIKGRAIPDFRLEVWTDVAEAYKEDNYAPHNNSVLWGSCMNNHDAVELYSTLGVEVLVLLDYNDEIHGRALLWKNVKFQFMHDCEDERPINRRETLNFLDRFYCHKDYLATKFIDYAKKHGYVYLWDYFSYNYPNKFIFEGKKMEGMAGKVFDIGIDYDAGFPYFDTMSFFYQSSRQCMFANTSEMYFVEQHLDGRIMEEGSAKNTDGTCEGFNQNAGGIYEDVWGNRGEADEFIDYCSGGIIHGEIAVFCEHLDGYIHEEEAVRGYDGEYIHEGSAVYCDDIEDYAHEDETAYCELMDINYLQENSVFSEIHQEEICEDLARESQEQGFYYPSLVSEIEYTDIKTGETHILLIGEDMTKVYHIGTDTVNPDDICFFDGQIYFVDEYHEMIEANTSDLATELESLTF